MESSRYSSPILVKLEFSRQFFEKYSNTNFHANPSSGNRVVPCGDGWTDGRADMTETISLVAFRNFADAAKYET